MSFDLTSTLILIIHPTPSKIYV